MGNRKTVVVRKTLGGQSKMLEELIHVEALN